MAKMAVKFVDFVPVGCACFGAPPPWSNRQGLVFWRRSGATLAPKMLRAIAVLLVALFSSVQAQECAVADGTVRQYSHEAAVTFNGLAAGNAPRVERWQTAEADKLEAAKSSALL